MLTLFDEASTNTDPGNVVELVVIDGAAVPAAVSAVVDLSNMDTGDEVVVSWLVDVAGLGLAWQPVYTVTVTAAAVEPRGVVMPPVPVQSSAKLAVEQTVGAVMFAVPWQVFTL